MQVTETERLVQNAEALRRLFEDVRATTEAICAPLSAEDQTVQSMPDASPVKWHQAHTTWFFETFLLAPHCPGYRSPDTRFRFFFNSYYKQLGGHPVRAQRGLWSRPSLSEVLDYRRCVDQNMRQWIESGVTPEIASLIELGCHHEQQHQELILTDIKHGLWINPLRPAYRDGADRNATTAAPPLTWVDFDGGIDCVGHEGDGFAFDNELPRHQVLLRPFRLASRLVTVGEYLDFMRDGGYSRSDLWLSEGWDTITAQGWRAPLYWEEGDDKRSIYTLDGVRPLNLAAPVCNVSYFEADAYARWAGARLATEFEWEVAACRCSSSANSPRPNLLDSNLLHPAPAPEHFNGPAQLFGDVWEWTASQYVAYPGFRAAAGAIGEYNGKFMCNQFVLRGGSCATPANHIRATYRNFFPPSARWQFTGIRLAHD